MSSEYATAKGSKLKLKGEKNHEAQEEEEGSH